MANPFPSTGGICSDFVDRIGSDQCKKPITKPYTQSATTDLANVRGCLKPGGEGRVRFNEALRHENCSTARAD